MPSFTSQVPDIVRAGPIVEVQIGPPQALVDALAARGETAPAPIRVMAMIDTGASGTVVSPEVTRHLGIHPVGVASMSTPSTVVPVRVDLFSINIAFPQGVTVSDVVATEAPLGGQEIQCLVGRDILRHGLLIYVGYINQFTLSF